MLSDKNLNRITSINNNNVVGSQPPEQIIYQQQPSNEFKQQLSILEPTCTKLVNNNSTPNNQIFTNEIAIQKLDLETTTQNLPQFVRIASGPLLA